MTYYENFTKFGHLDQVDVIVVPDRKTPAESVFALRGDVCEGIANQVSDDRGTGKLSDRASAFGPIRYPTIRTTAATSGT